MAFLCRYYNLFLNITSALQPAMLLILRFWMAHVFFVSGLVKIEDVDNTLALFRDEYAVPLLPPAFAAYSAMLFELSCPVLLVLGLMTRLATLPLLAMTAVIQFTYDQNIQHAYWAMLLGVILVFGPGAWSADHLLAKRLHKKDCRI